MIEIYEIKGKMVLVLLKNYFYIYLEKIKVIESRTKEPFTGFEPNKRYELRNGQVWQQIEGPYAPNLDSSGYVKIVNDRIMKVDSWAFFPQVVLIDK